jgi:hypothetical protein
VTNDEWGTTIRIYRIPRAGRDSFAVEDAPRAGKNISAAVITALTLENLASPNGVPAHYLNSPACFGSPEISQWIAPDGCIANVAPVSSPAGSAGIGRERAAVEFVQPFGFRCRGPIIRIPHRAIPER